MRDPGVFVMVSVVFLVSLFASYSVTAFTALLSAPSDAMILVGCAGIGLVVLSSAVVARWLFSGVFRRVRKLLSRALHSSLLVMLLPLLSGCMGCERIDAGNVGIKINLAGSDRGVQEIPFVTGYVFYNKLTEQVLEYPTFVQTTVWGKPGEGNSLNEEMSFNSSEGLPLSGDVSISYSLVSSKVPAFYVKFRSDDLNRFTHGFLRNETRDQFNEVAGTYPIEQLYGPKKEEFVETVKKRLNAKLGPIGIEIEQLGFVGAPRPPKSVLDAINLKIAATQQAIQIENEVRGARAQAEKQVAEAEGQAKSQLARAEGEAKSRVVRAQGEAKANAELVQSLSPALMEWRKLEISAAMVNKWNGGLPAVTTGDGHGLLMQLPNVSK